MSSIRSSSCSGVMSPRSAVGSGCAECRVPGSAECRVPRPGSAGYRGVPVGLSQTNRPGWSEISAGCTPCSSALERLGTGDWRARLERCWPGSRPPQTVRVRLGVPSHTGALLSPRQSPGDGRRPADRCTAGRRTGPDHVLAPGRQQIQPPRPPPEHH